MRRVFFLREGFRERFAAADNDGLRLSYAYEGNIEIMPWVWGLVVDVSGASAHWRRRLSVGYRYIQRFSYDLARASKIGSMAALLILVSSPCSCGELQEGWMEGAREGGGTEPKKAR